MTSILELRREIARVMTSDEDGWGNVDSPLDTVTIDLSRLETMVFALACMEWLESDACPPARVAQKAVILIERLATAVDEQKRG